MRGGHRAVSCSAERAGARPMRWRRLGWGAEAPMPLRVPGRSTALGRADRCAARLLRRGPTAAAGGLRVRWAVALRWPTGGEVSGQLGRGVLADGVGWAKEKEKAHGPGDLDRWKGGGDGLAGLRKGRVADWAGSGGLEEKVFLSFISVMVLLFLPR